MYVAVKPSAVQCVLTTVPARINRAGQPSSCPSCQNSYSLVLCLLPEPCDATVEKVCKFRVFLFARSIVL